MRKLKKLYFSTNPLGIEHAGFWLRLAAYITDFIIIALLASVLRLFMPTVFQSSSDQYFFNDFFVIIVGPVGFMVHILYYSIYDSSRFQATPGKMIVGLKVNKTDQTKINFRLALGRTLFKMLASIGLTFGIGCIISGFTKNKQALHDYAAGTYVIKDSNFNLKGKNIARLIIYILMGPIILAILYIATLSKY